MNTEPTIHIKINDKRVEMTRQNSSVWQFAAKLAMYNHIFIIDEEDNNYGYYWADKAKPNQYAKYIDYMTKNDYSLHINLWEICDEDKEAYERYHPAPPIEIPKAWEGII